MDAFSDSIDEETTWWQWRCAIHGAYPTKYIGIGSGPPKYPPSHHFYCDDGADGEYVRCEPPENPKKGTP